MSRRAALLRGLIRRSAPWVLAALCVLVATSAEATDAEARRHLALERDELLAARFEAALVELERALAEAESPELIAGLHREEGTIEAALDRHELALQAFLRALAIAPELTLDPEESGDLAAQIFECARTLRQLGAEAVELPAQPSGIFRCPRGSAPSLEPSPSPNPALLDPEPLPLQAVGLTAGAAALVTGGALAMVAFATRSDLDDGIREGRPLAELQATEARGKDFALAADVLVVSGLVLGVVAWALD